MDYKQKYLKYKKKYLDLKEQIAAGKRPRNHNCNRYCNAIKEQIEKMNSHLGNNNSAASNILEQDKKELIEIILKTPDNSISLTKSKELVASLTEYSNKIKDGSYESILTILARK